MKIGYQGKNGTFSEIATQQIFNDNNYESVNYQDFTSLISDVENGFIDYGVLPIENSTTGIIYRTYDLLKKYQVYAIKEHYLRIQEDLIGIKGAKLEDIKEVYSHPEPIIQCSNFLSQHNIKGINYVDTASSVELIKSLNDPSKAALASPLACHYFDMHTICANVQDNQNNTTRFFVISNQPAFAIDANKISLYLVVDHKPGALFKVIELFALNHINLLKIESRPIEAKLFEYCFYIDFEANIDNKITENLLKNLDNYCLDYKIIGSYHKASFI